jgi:hypothetical protein
MGILAVIQVTTAPCDITEGRAISRLWHSKHHISIIIMHAAVEELVEVMFTGGCALRLYDEGLGSSLFMDLEETEARNDYAGEGQH